MKLRNGKEVVIKIEKVECEYCEEKFDKNIFKDHECPNAEWCDTCNEFHENEEVEEVEEEQVYSICNCCQETFNDNEIFTNHDCPSGEYCVSCYNFHFIRKEKKVLNDNTELKIEDTKGEIIDMTCIVCLTNKRSVLFLPCAHLACCNTCNSQIESTCPVCRSDITEYKQVILC